MIEKIEMYTCNCDGCGESIGAISDYSAFFTAKDAAEAAMENDWHSDGEKHYCRKCYKLDEDGSVVIKYSQHIGKQTA